MIRVSVEVSSGEAARFRVEVWCCVLFSFNGPRRQSHLSALSELLRKAMINQDADFLKEGVRVLSPVFMEMEVQEHVGAAPHERSAERVGQRNGYRERSWDMRVGTVELKVCRVRHSSYFPSLLEPRRRAERASLPLSRRPTCTRTVTIVALQASGYGQVPEFL
jgi:hypothetical protein